jgi:AcrR family transcriptional regulator
MSRTAESRARPADGAALPDPVRSRILRGAARVFGERGYGASSVEAILEAAQVSRRTFYRTFRSKEDVLRTLFDNSVQMLIRAVREATTEHKSQPDLAAPAVDAYLRVHATAGPLARVLLLEQFSPGSPLAEQRNRAFATFSKLMTQASTTAGRAPTDPLLVAAVVAGVNQVCVQMATEHPNGNWDVARAKRAILRILSVLDLPPAAVAD